LESIGAAYNAPVLRQLINACLIVALLLQGVAQTSVDPQSHVSQHCADHESDRDCSCCDEEQMTMASGCAALCSVMAGMSRISLELPSLPSGAVDGLTVQWRAGPAYLPLIPPPIS
jgi:hypothetical protein